MTDKEYIIEKCQIIFDALFAINNGDPEYPDEDEDDCLTRNLYIICHAASDIKSKVLKK